MTTQDLKSQAEKHLAGETEVEFQCAVAANDDLEEDVCDHEPETITLDEPAFIDDNNRIHLPGRPVDCPVCGNPHEFVFNGVWVFFG